MKELLDYKLRVISIEHSIDDIREEFNKIPIYLNDEDQDKLNTMSSNMAKLLEELKQVQFIIKEMQQIVNCRNCGDLLNDIQARFGFCDEECINEYIETQC